MDAVPHRIEKFSLEIDSAFDPFFRPIDGMMRRLTPLVDGLVDRVGPPLASVFFAVGLAVKVAEPDEHFSETAQVMWAEAQERGIEMYEVRPLGIPCRIFVAKYKGKAFAFEGLPRLARKQKSLQWVDDKAEVKKRFEKAGFPVPRGGSAATEAEALQIFETLQKPVITKPQEGSGGRHTSVHIMNEQELRQGYRNAKMIAPKVVVEEEMTGPVFRATLIDGRLVAVLQRDPPQVTGDGRSTLRELVAEENFNPLRRGPVFADIQIDSAAAKRELARQRLTPESVPAKGQKVQFHFKVNWGVGGTSHDVTDETHPDNQKLFEDVGAYLGEDIVGLDFIITDISKSWRQEKRCGIIECNSLPLIGNHHFPYKGPVRNVAAAVWEMVFPELK